MSRNYEIPDYMKKTVLTFAEYWKTIKEKSEEKNIQVDRHHKQPETKPGVYIAECLNASFAKEPNVLPLPQGVRISTIAATHPVNIGTPETFKIGDRVRVIDLNMDVSPGTYPDYERTLNQFGRLDSNAGELFRVHFPQFADYIWYLGKQLKKEFAVGDKVYCRRYSTGAGVIKGGPDIYGDYTVDFYGSIVKTTYDYLEYIPETKKSGDDLTIKAGGTFTLNSGNCTKLGENMDRIKFNKNMDAFTFGPGPDTFKLNQPIFMDKQAENRLDRGAHSYSVKFLTAEDIDKETKMKKEIDQILGSIKVPQTTYSATIVLASGRVVNVPNPNEKDWTLKSTEKVTRIEPVLLDHEEGNEDVDEFVLNSFVEHEEGLCWLKDMARIIEQKDVVSPFETKFSYVTEIRKYVRKPIEKPSYECTMPALRCLW